MTVDFEQQGRALLARGYTIIPIAAGQKRPAIPKWQHARLTAADLPKFAGCGVGVLPGVGEVPLTAADADIKRPALAAAYLAWMREYLGLTVERVGAAPKVMLIYRAAEAGWAKATSAWYAEPGVTDIHQADRVEFLGAGQQFVAYAIHPDTGKPYEWIDLIGGLDEIDAADLPVLTREHVTQALEAFERLAREHGLVPVKAGKAGATTASAAHPGGDDPLMAYEPPVGLPMAEAARYLTFVDNEEYDTWIKAGASLHHEYGGSDEALRVWDDWSSTADNYQGMSDLATRWEGFGKSDRRPITIRWLLKFGREGEKVAVLAEKHSVLDDAKARIAACDDQIALVSTIAKEVGRDAGEDLALRAQLAGMIRAKFKSLTGMALSAADVKAAMRTAPVVDVAALAAGGGRREDSELGLVARFMDRYGNGLMYVPEMDRWFKWTGTLWKGSNVVEIHHLIKEVIKDLPREHELIQNESERSRFFEFVRRSQNQNAVKNVSDSARSEMAVYVPAEELDRDPMLLGVANGAVDLRTGKLLPPTREHRITIASRTRYRPEAKCDLFEATLLDVFNGDREMVGFFQRLAGYSILGNPKEDVIAVLHGGGSNGKSTILNAIRDTLGPHGAVSDPTTIMETKGKGSAGGPREDLLRLRGKRLVTVAEPPEGAVLNESVVKTMTGGDPVPARGVHSRYTIEVRPSWVVFMLTNHRPTIKGDDDGIWRRVLLVPFERNFKKEGLDDTDREDRLRAEREGILAWLVRGALEYLRDGLRPPKVVQDAGSEYREDMDLLSSWLETCCTVDPNARESNTVLWASWSQYAKTRGELLFIPSEKSLGRKLRTRFKGYKSNGNRGFCGIKVNQVGEFE